LAFCFQEEGGIRYGAVTGVQTCALPIFWRSNTSAAHLHDVDEGLLLQINGRLRAPDRLDERLVVAHVAVPGEPVAGRRGRDDEQIGRASCREREEMSAGAGALDRSSEGD